MYAITDRSSNLFKLDGVLDQIDRKVMLDEETLIKIDPQTGLILAIREFDVIYAKGQYGNMLITHASKNVQLVKQWDSQGRSTHSVLYMVN